MIAALASLGIVYSEEDMDLIYDQLVADYGAVTFEAFINLLVCPQSKSRCQSSDSGKGGYHRRPDVARPTA